MSSTGDRWEYATVEVDAWMPLGAQAGVKGLLASMGGEGWEAFATTPATPPTLVGDDPDVSVYEILLRRRLDG